MGKRQGDSWSIQENPFLFSLVSSLEQGRHTPACVYESPWTVEAPHGTGLSASLLLICFLLFHCICRVCVVWRQLWEWVEINTVKSNPYIQKATNFMRRWSGFSAESHVVFQQLTAEKLTCKLAHISPSPVCSFPESSVS